MAKKKDSKTSKYTNTTATMAELPAVVDAIRKFGVPGGLYIKIVHVGDNLFQYTEALKKAFDCVLKLRNEGDVEPPIVRYKGLELHFSFNIKEEKP